MKEERRERPPGRERRRPMVGGSPGQFGRKEAFTALAALSGALLVAVTVYRFFQVYLPPNAPVLRTVVSTAFDLTCVAPVAWWTLIRPLWRSQDALRTFFNHAPVGLFRSTVEGRLTLVNQTLVELLGYDVTDAMFQVDLAKAVYRSPEERARIVAKLRDVDVFEGVEVAWKRRDGSPITVLLSGRTIRDADGRATGFEGSAQNVTEHRRTQSHLRLVEHALHAAANAIAITDRDGAIEWVNEGFTRITGYRLEEVAGMTPRVLKSGRTPMAEYTELWATITAGRPWQGEFVNRRKDGTFYNQDLTITPLPGDDGDISHFIGVGRDVTEQRRLEAQLRQAQKMEAIGELTGGIAHDFNNLLAVILANAELLANAGPLPDPGSHADLEEIREAASRGAAMVRKLLGFSRVAELQMLPVDLGEVIRGMSALLRRLLPESVAIETEVAEAIPVVRADVGAIEQIVINLATNARDAMPEGGSLRITVTPEVIGAEDHEIHPWVSVGRYACVAVTDTGHGMDPATRQRIFEPFFTTKPPGRGTGLGMPMIYGLTRQHGGAVHVYSEVGKGTTIRIYLPAAADAAVGLHALPTPSLRPGRGELILLVEDEESLRRSGRRILERLGYRVLLAADGTEALELFEAHRADVALIISDLIMPKLGGKELFEAIRRGGHQIPFILATGYAAAELRASGKLIDPVTHLPKPWTLAEVAEAVRTALEGGS